MISFDEEKTLAKFSSTYDSRINDLEYFFNNTVKGSVEILEDTNNIFVVGSLEFFTIHAVVFCLTDLVTSIFNTVLSFAFIEVKFYIKDASVKNLIFYKKYPNGNLSLLSEELNLLKDTIKETIKDDSKAKIIFKVKISAMKRSFLDFSYDEFKIRLIDFCLKYNNNIKIKNEYEVHEDRLIFPSRTIKDKII